MRDALQRHPELRTAELHLNEWNPYRIDYPRGGRQDRYPMAAAFLHGVKHFLDMPWLTRVYFAQFQDSGGGNYSGMIDIDGFRKAVFDAYALYQLMPDDRVRLTTDDAAIEGVASRPTRQRCVLLWNDSDQARTLDLRYASSGGSFPAYDVRRIDADHRGEDRTRPAIAGSLEITPCGPATTGRT